VRRFGGTHTRRRPFSIRHGSGADICLIVLWICSSAVTNGGVAASSAASGLTIIVERDANGDAAISAARLRGQVLAAGDNGPDGGRQLSDAFLQIGRSDRITIAAKKISPARVRRCA